MINNNNNIFYTIGYSKKTIDQFIKLLKSNNIHILIDVRNNVFSYKPEFDNRGEKKRLQTTLEQNNIQYWHMPELGVPSDKRKNLNEKKPETYTELWKWYDENVISNYLDNLLSQLSIVNQPVAFMCTEVEPHLCHRHRIARALEGRDMMIKGKDL
jgi:uncharacterized protein (DUF488 family)